MESIVQDGTYKLIVSYDEGVPSPRQSDENLGKMICFHKRYSLGDKHSYQNKDEFIFDLLVTTIGDSDKAEMKYGKLTSKVDRSLYRRQSDLSKAVDDEILSYVERSFVILPLFLFDHSGLTMNTTGFSCSWDSGQIGWIYASHEDIKREFSKKKIQKAKSVLINEVVRYDSYLRGECFCYKLCEEGKIIDCCNGFIGNFEDVVKDIKDNLHNKFSYLINSLKFNENITIR